MPTAPFNGKKQSKRLASGGGLPLWDNAHKSPSVALSSGDTIATGVVGNSGNARSVLGFSSGVRTFQIEIIVGDTSANTMWVGFQNASHPQTDGGDSWGGGTPNVVGLYNELGSLWAPDGVGGENIYGNDPSSVFTTGDIITGVIDFGAGTATLEVNSAGLRVVPFIPPGTLYVSVGFDNKANQGRLLSYG
jgi:hypothetical protein